MKKVVIKKIEAIKPKSIFWGIVIVSCMNVNLLSAVITLSTHKKGGWGALQPKFLMDIRQSFKANVFVETGTWYAKTTELAANSGFAEVYSVELEETLYEEAKKKLHHKSNVFLFYGHSPYIISSLAPKLKNRRVVFWLDAHPQIPVKSPETNPADVATPVIKEIEAISKTGVSDSIVLIDDIRYFGAQIGDQKFMGIWSYTMTDICTALLAVNKNFEFVVIGDILLAYDKTKHSFLVSPVIKAWTTLRLFNGKNATDRELLNAESVIAQAKGPEKKFIYALHEVMKDYSYPQFHHTLCYGLVCMADGRNKEAHDAFMKIINSSGYRHSRIYTYAKQASAAISNK